MFSDPAFLAAAFIAVLLVGLAKGGFSGIGMAATPLLALTMPPLKALAILLPILMMQDVISVWWYRHDWDPWNVKVMLPGAVVGTALAWALASIVPDDAVRLLIGAIGVLFVLNVWFGRMPPARRPSAASGVFWGGASAFTSTIASAGMPPFSVHVLPPRSLLRAWPAHARDAFHLACADAARDRDQFPRLLSGAAHSDRAVLPDHLHADVSDFRGAAGAGRHRVMARMALRRVN